MDSIVFQQAKQGSFPNASLWQPPSFTPLPFAHSKLDAAWGPGNYALVQAIWAFPEDTGTGRPSAVLVRPEVPEGFTIYPPPDLAYLDEAAVWGPQLLGKDDSRLDGLEAQLAEGPVHLDGQISLSEAITSWNLSFQRDRFYPSFYDSARAWQPTWTFDFWLDRHTFTGLWEGKPYRLDAEADGFVQVDVMLRPEATQQDADHLMARLWQAWGSEPGPVSLLPWNCEPGLFTDKDASWLHDSSGP